MGKVTAEVVAALKALYETGDTLTEDNFATVFDVLADAAEDHGHSSLGGPGTGTGDAGPVVNLQHGLEGGRPVVPAVGDCYVETDTATLYVCYVVGEWTAV